VFIVFFVVSDPCDELITLSKECYRVCGFIIVCDTRRNLNSEEEQALTALLHRRKRSILSELNKSQRVSNFSLNFRFISYTLYNLLIDAD
jgi:hypothetical protein